MIGKLAKAPCGHDGETVVGGFVRCFTCRDDAAPQHIRPERTECLHGGARYYWNGVWWCTPCGRMLGAKP